MELTLPRPRYFSVDGLFLTIANELALMKTDRPFNAPKGTKVVMRFQPDSKLGYPHWYRRDVMGTSQMMTIDVLQLVRSHRFQNRRILESRSRSSLGRVARVSAFPAAAVSQRAGKPESFGLYFR